MNWKNHKSFRGWPRNFTEKTSESFAGLFPFSFGENIGNHCSIKTSFPPRLVSSTCRPTARVFFGEHLQLKGNGQRPSDSALSLLNNFPFPPPFSFLPFSPMWTSAATTRRTKTWEGFGQRTRPCRALRSTPRETFGSSTASPTAN